MKRPFFILMAVFAATSARADFLFVNLNDSAEEIKYAKRALENINKVHAKKGEPLEELVEVPPPLSKKERRKLDDLAVFIRKTNRLVKKECVGQSTAKCVAAQASLKDLNAQKQVLRDKTKFTEDGLRAALAAQVARNRDFRSAILSGHDGTGTFSGLNGNLSDVKFGNMMKEFPTLSQGLTTLYPWGCYTANPGAIENMWKKNFPYLAAVIGYDYKSTAEKSSVAL